MLSYDRITYPHGEVVTAMCIWEWMIDNRSHADDSAPAWKRAIDELFDNYGTAEMRDLVIRAVPIVEGCLLALEENHPLREVSFDWEFVPALCRHIDWTELYQKEMDMQGSERLLALLNATEALGV